MNRPQVETMVNDLVGSNPDAVGWILAALSAAASETGRHVGDNWQDGKGERQWMKIVAAIDRAALAFEQHKPW